MMSSGFLQRCGLFLGHSKGILLGYCAVAHFGKQLNVSGTRKLTTSCVSCGSGTSLSTNSPFRKNIDTIFRAIFKRKSFLRSNGNMGYFVIGVSGVTCGGKTTLTKLLLRKFPWAVVIHQDHYFFDDDYPQHIRVPESENHVNYEILEALDMPKMYKDVQAILEAPPKFKQSTSSTIQSNGVNGGSGDKAETPNFDDTFLQQIPDINFDVSKYNKVPILIIEGFTIFASQFLFDKCHARFFCSLDRETCRQRRSLREYFPPDSPSYFDKIIWPEYQKHYDSYIHKRPGVTEFDGNMLMSDLWKASVQIIACRIEEQFGNKTAANGVTVTT